VYEPASKRLGGGQSKSARLVLGTDVNKLSLTDLLLLEGQVIRKKVVIFDERRCPSKSRSRSPPEGKSPQGNMNVNTRIKQVINDKIQKRSIFAKDPANKRSKSREDTKAKDEKVLIDISKKAQSIASSRSGKRNNGI
jgi:hypothetical protein